MDSVRRAKASAERLLFRICSLEPMDCSERSWIWSPHPEASRRTFICRSSTPATACWRRCAGLTRSTYYAAFVDDIRSRMPNASIGSDIIVGFPGETDDDFDQLAAYLERSPLTHVHVFPYSDRPGTAASACRTRYTVRRSGSAGVAFATSVAYSPSGSVLRRWGRSHRALTLEDGTLAVTENYLKVRIPAGSARNEWVRLRLTSEDDGESAARLTSSALRRSADRRRRGCRGRGSCAPTP